MRKNKQQTMFVCRECGYETIKWLGKCPECNSWNSFIETKTSFEVDKTKPFRITDFSSEVLPLNQISDASVSKRILTHITEFDRIMGGGIVPGSIILLGGEPGIGKSTLMLQVADKIITSCLKDNQEIKVLYVSGEESVQQVKLRAQRLNINNDKIFVVSETSIERITEIVENLSVDVLILDSIQTLYSEYIPNTQGSIPQVRGVTAEVIKFAKGKNITVFILGHVTKEGDIAGPRLLEHMVDTVLYFESETMQNYRILRVYKNRFGPTSEIGVFEMTSLGLKEIPNPSELFVEHHTNRVGTVTTCILEGTRPILTQIQSLVTKSYFPQPRRVVSGIDYNRAILLISVLEKFAGITLMYEDVYLNIISGLKTKETAIDLAICVAIFSAHKNLEVDSNTVYLGEVGLTGEVRPISFLNERLNEIVKLGYKKIFIPKLADRIVAQRKDCEIFIIETIKEIEKIV